MYEPCIVIALDTSCTHHDPVPLTYISRSNDFVKIYIESRNLTSNKNIKMSSFKSSENIQKKVGGPDRSVSDNQSSSVTLN